jgi:hypothetical protein
MGMQNLQAQYEIMRMSILSTFIRMPEACNPAYAFAWYSRMMPLGLGHDNELVFNDAADIPTSKVGIVLGAVKQLELSKRFNELTPEKLLKNVRYVDNTQLVIILEYLGLKGDLTQDVINALEADINSPRLRRNFLPEDVRFPEPRR